MRLVTDTGPVVHLHEAGALHLLPLIGDVALPLLVLTEVRTRSPSLWPESPPEWVGIQTPTPNAQRRAQAWRQANLMHGGESEGPSVGMGNETRLVSNG